MDQKVNIEILLPMFDTMQNTLELIETRGRDNHDRMLGCMSAVDEMKSIVLAYIDQTKKEGVETDNVRSGNIGTDSCNKR